MSLRWPGPRVRSDRLHVVPLAPRAGFTLDPGDARAEASSDAPAAEAPADEARHLGLVPGRYFAYTGRYDVRQDLATLLRALAALGAEGRPAGAPPDDPWPPRVLLAGATPDDRAALARGAAREGVGEALAYAPAMPAARLAALIRAARGALLPVLSEATGLAAVESIAVGTPVVASAVGALPEIVGPAGLLVEPRDPARLATAIRALWTDDALHARLVATTRVRAMSERRTWAEVAEATRRVYAEVGVRA